jgi:hypothetical protein
VPHAESWQRAASIARERIERVPPKPNKEELTMILCPIALVVGCKKCPAFTVCPLKEVIGDYKKPDETQTKQRVENAPSGVNRDR